MTYETPMSGVDDNAAELRASLQQTAQEGEQVARLLSDAFKDVGDEISDSLSKAASSGALSFDDMVQSIVQSLSQLALDKFVSEPLPGLLSSAGSVLEGLFDGIIGQRAEGGPVMAGERYLVGERGPEVFTPFQSGGVEPLGSAPVSVTIITQGAPSDAVQRSETQIAAAVARAVEQGRSRL